MEKVKVLLTLFLPLLFLSCTTTQKAVMNSDNPPDAIVEVKSLRENARQNNVDVLAYEFYKNGNEKLAEAIKDFREGDPRKEVMDGLAEAKAYFLEAETVALSRSQVPGRIMEARQKATMPNVYENKELLEELREVDEKLIEETGNFSRGLVVKKYSKFQKSYLDLETRAVQDRELGYFRALVKKAKDHDAKTLAPETYTEANADLKVAENMIAQGPRNPLVYRNSVIEADKSVKLLDDVMNKLTGTAKGSPEKVALTLVHQERKLGKLSDRVQVLNSSLNETANELADKTYKLEKKSDDLERTSEELNSKKSQLKMTSEQLEATNNQLAATTVAALSAHDKVRFQKAMDQVRNNFSEDEAEVYQQGKKLIIRIRDIDFKTGSAKLPAQSKSLLKKINKIVKDLEPKEIKIEGHTDSTGPESLNARLSKKRSEAVAGFLSSLENDFEIKTEGLGESDPIANNETAKGRALNRRVDVVITADRS